MARPSPSCAHDDDRLRLPPASPSRSNSAEKKESTVRRLSQLCPPCATPSSNFSLDYRRSDARIVKNGFAASSGVSKSAKVVLGRVTHKSGLCGNRWLPQTTALRRLDYQEFIGARKHLVLAVLSYTGPPIGATG